MSLFQWTANPGGQELQVWAEWPEMSQCLPWRYLVSLGGGCRSRASLGPLLGPGSECSLLGTLCDLRTLIFWLHWSLPPSSGQSPPEGHGGWKDGSILVKIHQIRAGGEKASANYGESFRGLSVRHFRIFIEGFVCVCIFKIFSFFVCIKVLFFFLMETSLRPLETHLQL